MDISTPVTGNIGSIGQSTLPNGGGSQPQQQGSVAAGKNNINFVEIRENTIQKKMPMSDFAKKNP